jgi:regulator of sigma E protease
VADSLLLAFDITAWMSGLTLFLKVLIGFSIIIFVHELGHFLMAKWMGVRVMRFAVGFFYRLVGYRKGEGLTFGPRPEYSPEQIAEKGYGETDYCLNLLPFGGYVKMLGEDDIIVDEKTGEVQRTDDPHSFQNKAVWKRMIVVSGGVVFNVLFAIIAYAAVFLTVGKDMPAPVIGYVDPGSNAADAGLQVGDRVVTVEGREVQSFLDIQEAWVLSDDSLRFGIERDGERIDRDFVARVERDSEGQKRPIGVFPVSRPVLGELVAQKDGEAAPGDLITRVNGQPIEGIQDITLAVQQSKGEPLEFTVERRVAGSDERAKTFIYRDTPLLSIDATVRQGVEFAVQDSRHLLGLQRRQAVNIVDPGKPADEAGMQPGDVIVQWDSTVNPLYGDIVESIYAHDGKPVDVVVARDGELLELTVTPRSPLRLFGTGRAKVGVGFMSESDDPIVADVAPGTPAASIGIPSGARITAIDDEPVDTWADVYEALRARQGASVTVHYRSGDVAAAGTMDVPPSIASALDLPPGAAIVKIAGEDRVRLPDGRRLALPSEYAVSELLKQHVGETIEVQYRDNLTAAELKTAEFTVTAENVDPWPLRVQYGFRVLNLEPEFEKVTAHGNPLVAVELGIKQSYRVLASVYRAITNIAAQNVSVGHVAGPVGIFQFAIREAEAGFGDLLFFLAFISINLAVINFLPLPVMDGGMMVFLLLEKIRGKPLSVQVQVITTLAGLALILLTFLFVTINDIYRLVGG